MNANECAAARRSQCKGQEPWNESLEALSALRGWSASWYQSPLPAGYIKSTSLETQEDDNIKLKENTFTVENESE